MKFSRRKFILFLLVFLLVQNLNAAKKKKAAESENSQNKQKDNDKILIDLYEVLDILKEFYNVKNKKAKEKMDSNATSNSQGGEIFR